MTDSRLLDTHTVYSGHAPGQVVRCCLTDTGATRGVFSLVMFFEQALDETRLREGLARALGHVPAFGGRLRLRDDILEIVCDDSGVPLTTAEFGHNLPQTITELTKPGTDLVQPIDGKAAWSGELPLLAVRMNRLTDGGMALGCTWHHAIGDLRSFVLLMQAWSAFVEGTAPPAVILAENREEYLDTILPVTDCGRPGYRLMDPTEAQAQRSAAGRAVRETRNLEIYFTDVEVSRLRQRFSDAAGRKLSANDVLCAHIVTTISRFQDEPRTAHLSMPVDIRNRLGLPNGVIGNLTSDMRVPCRPEMGPEAVAADIRTGLDDFVRSHLNLRSTRDFLAGHRGSLRDCFPLGFNLARREFTISNLSGSGLYDITFEGQHPTYVCPTPSPFPWLGLLIEGFGKAGFLCAIGVPEGLGELLAGRSGRAALHPTREPGDTLPDLAADML